MKTIQTDTFQDTSKYTEMEVIQKDNDAEQAKAQTFAEDLSESVDKIMRIYVSTSKGSHVVDDPDKQDDKGEVISRVNLERELRKRFYEELNRKFGVK